MRIRSAMSAVALLVSLSFATSTQAEAPDACESAKDALRALLDDEPAVEEVLDTLVAILESCDDPVVEYTNDCFHIVYPSYAPPVFYTPLTMIQCVWTFSGATLLASYSIYYNYETHAWEASIEEGAPCFGEDAPSVPAPATVDEDVQAAACYQVMDYGGAAGVLAVDLCCVPPEAVHTTVLEESPVGVERCNFGLSPSGPFYMGGCTTPTQTDTRLIHDSVVVCHTSSARAAGIVVLTAHDYAPC